MDRSTRLVILIKNIYIVYTRPFFFDFTNLLTAKSGLEDPHACWKKFERAREEIVYSLLSGPFLSFLFITYKVQVEISCWHYSLKSYALFIYSKNKILGDFSNAFIVSLSQKVLQS